MAILSAEKNWALVDLSMASNLNQIPQLIENELPFPYITHEPQVVSKFSVSQSVAALAINKLFVTRPNGKYWIQSLEREVLGKNKVNEFPLTLSV